jgi:hypothetical protein
MVIIQDGSRPDGGIPGNGSKTDKGITGINGTKTDKTVIMLRMTKKYCDSFDKKALLNLFMV